MTSLLDYVHLSLGFSWPLTILVASILVRIPISMMQLTTVGDTAKLQQLGKPLQALHGKLADAKTKGDQALAHMHLMQIQELYQKFNISPLLAFKAVGFQVATIPIQIGLFLALRRISDLPVADMAATSWAWIPSLTAPDPYYVLPFLNLLATQGTLYFTLRDSTSLGQSHAMNFFRVLSVPMALWLSTMSGSINMLVMINATWLGFQGFLLRAPGIRRMMGLPIITADQKIKAPSLAESFKAMKEGVMNNFESVQKTYGEPIENGQNRNKVRNRQRARGEALVNGGNRREQADWRARLK
jgi:YidC/Oxa1 family membrane protein insertase